MLRCMPHIAAMCGVVWLVVGFMLHWSMLPCCCGVACFFVASLRGDRIGHAVPQLRCTPAVFTPQLLRGSCVRMKREAPEQARLAHSTTEDSALCACVAKQATIARLCHAQRADSEPPTLPAVPAHVRTCVRLSTSSDTWAHPCPHLLPRLGSPLPHLRRDWAQLFHICTGTAWAHPCRHLHWESAPNLRVAEQPRRPSHRVEFHEHVRSRPRALLG